MTSPSACVSSQVTTSAIDAPRSRAAKSIGASSLAAAAYQKSASASARLPVEAPSASHAAVRRAIAQSPQPSSGVQFALSSPVSPAGSKSWTRPTALPRVDRVAQQVGLDARRQHRARRHSRIAGIASPVVLPVCVGATTSADWPALGGERGGGRAGRA